MKKYKIIFWIIWLVIVTIGPYTISKNIVFPKVFSDYGLTLNFLERLSGVFIFTLLFIQIILGAYMKKLTSRFGGWIFKVHAIQGPIIYFLALIIHPFFLLIFNFKLFHTIDPFYIYTQVCFLCKNKLELFYTFGRLAIWFLVVGIFAANWKKSYLFSYVAFFFVALHAWFVGSDFHSSPLKYVFWLAIVAVFLAGYKEVRSKKQKE